MKNDKSYRSSNNREIRHDLKSQTAKSWRIRTWISGLYLSFKSAINSPTLSSMSPTMTTMTMSLSLHLSLPQKVRSSTSQNQISSNTNKSNLAFEGKIQSVNSTRQTLVDILRDCVEQTSLKTTKSVHGLVLKSEFSDLDFLILLNHIAHAYTECSDFESARQVFDEMQQKNAFSYSVMIVASTENRFFVEGFEFFLEMVNRGILPDKFAYSAIIRTCINLDSVELGKMIHAQIVSSGFLSESYVGVSLINMYAKLGLIEDSYQVFIDMSERNEASCNAMISGFTLNGLHTEAYNLFLEMEKEGVYPDKYTIISVSKAVGKLGDIDKGRFVHRFASNLGLDSTILVGTSLIDMFSKCNSLSDARSIFDTNFIHGNSNPPWNAMISGYSQNGYSHEALEFFNSMCKKNVQPDIYTYCSVLSAIAAMNKTLLVKEVHAMVLKSGLEQKISVSNAIVDAYAKSKLLEDVEKVFDRVQRRDIVTWTTFISAFSQCSYFEEALIGFSKMREEGFIPNQFTFSIVIDACASLAFLDSGRQIHALLCKAGLKPDKCTESALIKMYSKCGFISEAKTVFENISDPDSVSWTAMISGYAQHGLVENALKLFTEMEKSGKKVNSVTLLCILFACSHRGMVERGLHYFHQMEDIYDIVPEMEHYACIVDLLGRVGRLSEAVEFIEKMPIEPDEMIWQTVLAACRVHRNAELAKMAAEKILSVTPDSSETYVLLSNAYIETGNYKDGISLRHLMKDRGVRKEAGCSWISVKGKVHKFYSRDRFHPQKDQIFAMLEALRIVIKSRDYVPDLSFE